MSPSCGCARAASRSEVPIRPPVGPSPIASRMASAMPAGVPCPCVLTSREHCSDSNGAQHPLFPLCAKVQGWGLYMRPLKRRPAQSEGDRTRVPGRGRQKEGLRSRVSEGVGASVRECALEEALHRPEAEGERTGSAAPLARNQGSGVTSHQTFPLPGSAPERKGSRLRAREGLEAPEARLQAQGKG